MLKRNLYHCKQKIEEKFGIILVKGWRIIEARTERGERERGEQKRGKIDTLWNALMESIELTLNKEKNLVNFWCGTNAIVISFSAAYQFNTTLANCVNRLNIVIIYLILVSTRLHSPTFYICHCILIRCKTDYVLVCYFSRCCRCRFLLLLLFLALLIEGFSHFRLLFH